ncbi:MAG: DUF342 domain-containing protein, partial [Spirochaetia bacterium]|nr:DUF342 domain-containing protein [Spirochaetia bacterium]
MPDKKDPKQTLDEELKALQEESLRLTEALENDIHLEPLLTHPSPRLDKRGAKPATGFDSRKEKEKIPPASAVIKTQSSARDAFFRIELGQDASTASLSLFPQVGGGKPGDTKEILEALRKKGVNFGIQEEILKKAVEDMNQTGHPVQELVVARGQDPEDGADAVLAEVASFQNREEFSASHPEEHLPSDIEYEGYAVVNAGDPLVKITPETGGKNGSTVNSRLLPAKPGKNPFEAGLNVASKKEGELLFFNAKIGGIAVLRDKEYSVLPFRETNVRVKCYENDFKANLAISPPPDLWKPPTLERIHEEIKKEGVVYGLKYEVIEKEFNAFLKDHEPRDFLIAEGDFPEDGEDGALDFHIPMEKKSVVSPDENGRIDYRLRLNVILVEKGKLLCTVKSPTPARRNAITVKNKTVSARDGEPVRFTVLGGMREEKVDERRSNYFSELDGEVDYNPIKGEIRVSQSKTVDAIDMTLGNLSYIGNVTVNQNIEDGMEVTIKGDLFVKGLIMGAKVKVEGNVSCEGGIITKENGYLRVSGDLKARFIENSNVQASGEIQVERAILNSHVSSGKSIIAISEKSYALGGVIQAKERIALRYLGNESGTRGVVQLGADPLHIERYHEIITRLRLLKDDLAKFDLMIQKLLESSRIET